MYWKNTDLLIGNLIGKEKLEELSDKASNKIKIYETLKLTNGQEYVFYYDFK